MNYLKNFNEQGFVIIKNFLSEKEIADIFYDLKSMIDEIITKNINFKDLKDLDKKYLELKKKNPLLKSHFYDLISRLESVQRVFFKPQIIKFINSVLESPVIIDGIQMRIDDPSNDRMLPMHQERGQISHRTLTAWCPLIDITESSGGIQIVPASHKLGDLEVYTYDSNMNYTGVHPKYLQNVKKIFMGKGDILIFHWDLIHGTFISSEKKARWTVVGRYNSSKQAPYLTDVEAPLNIPKNAQITYQRIM